MLKVLAYRVLFFIAVIPALILGFIPYISSYVDDIMCFLIKEGELLNI